MLINFIAFKKIVCHVLNRKLLAKDGNCLNKSFSWNCAFLLMDYNLQLVLYWTGRREKSTGKQLIIVIAAGFKVLLTVCV